MGSPRAAALLLACCWTVSLAATPAAHKPRVDRAGREVTASTGAHINYRSAAVSKAAAKAEHPKAVAQLRRPKGAVAGAARPGSVHAGTAPGKRKAAATRALPLAAAQVPTYEEEWRLYTWGSGIGATGFWPVDADNDGDLEFIVGGGSGFSGNLYWSIVDHDAASGEYQLKWQSARELNSSISALRVIAAGGTPSVWVGRDDGRIEVVNVLTRATLATVTPSSDAIVDLAYADADNDGHLDVVALSNAAIFIIDPATHSVRRSLPYGGQRLAVGDVDGDGNNEIVLDAGWVLRSVGGSTAVEWQTAAFGNRIGLADIDGDGKDELVASEGWYHIKAWDLDLHSPKWDHQTAINIDALRLIDVTGDGHEEVLYGDGQWGAIYALSAADGTELWSIPNPDHGTTDIAVFDSDGDGQPEVLWGAGWSSTGPDYLHVHDLATHTSEWSNLDFSGPFVAMDVGDVDLDGHAEFVTISYDSESGYADGVMSIVDALTHELKWRSATDLFNRFAWTGVHALRIANVDADPQPEIIVGTDRLYDGALFIIDGVSHAVEHEYEYDSGSPLNALAVADLDGDGHPEVIAGNSYAHSGSPGIFISVIDPATGAVKWKTTSLASAGVESVLVSDVGSPGTDLLIAAGPIFRIKWSNKQTISSIGTNFRTVAVVDSDGSGTLRVVAGRDDGALEVLDGETLASLATYPVCAESIYALRDHGPHQVALTCGARLVIYDLMTQSIVSDATSSIPDLGISGSLVRTNVAGKATYFAGGASAVELTDLSGNTPPTVSGASYTLHWRDSLDIDLSGHDADGDDLSFELVSLPLKGGVRWSDRAAGNFTYTSYRAGTGVDVITFHAHDGFQYSDPQTITLTLTNAVPSASTDHINLHWRGAQQVHLGGADADDDPITFRLIDTPVTLAASLDRDSGTLTLTPPGTGLGSDSLSYRVSDYVQASPVRHVEITLVNNKPTLAGAQFDVGSIAVQSRVNGEDADDDPLTYAVVGQPSEGTFTLEPDTGLFTYTPSQDGNGTDTVSITVSDGLATSQSVSLSFRYASSDTGHSGGGGGALDWLGLALLGARLVRRLGRRAA